MKTGEKLSRKYTFYYIKYTNTITHKEYYIGKHPNYSNYCLMEIDKNHLLVHGNFYSFYSKSEALDFIRDNTDELSEFINNEINSKEKGVDKEFKKHLGVISIDAKFAGVISHIDEYTEFEECASKYIICINNFYYIDFKEILSQNINNAMQYHSTETVNKALDKFIDNNKNTIIAFSGLSIEEFKKERTRIIKL